MMWKDSYRLGVERIDEQHIELFRMTEDLVNAVKNRATAEVYQKALGFLKDYVIYHFRDEEAYQESIHYCDSEAHKQEHRQFTQTVLDYERRLTEHGFESFDASAFDLKGQVKYLIVKDDSGVSSIGSLAFSHATTNSPDTPLSEDGYNTILESVDLSGVTKISAGAFKWCSALKELSLSGVQEISHGAFYYDSGLTKIELPGVKILGKMRLDIVKI